MQVGPLVVLLPLTTGRRGPVEKDPPTSLQRSLGIGRSSVELQVKQVMIIYFSQPWQW